MPQQRRLDGLFGRLLELPAPEPAKVVRRIEQAQQGRGLLLGPGLGIEVFAREVGEAEVLVGREFPGQVEVDLAGQGLGLRHQLGWGGLVEAKHHVG